MLIYFLILFVVCYEKENLVKNPSFELLNNNNYPLDWNFVTGGAISSDSYSGRNSLHFKTMSTKNILSQFFTDTFEKGFRYKICAAFKLINVNNFQIYLQNREFTNDTYEGFYTDSYSGTLDWRKECYNTHHLLLTRTKFTLGFYAHPQEAPEGDIFIDDVSITRIDELLILGINNDRDEVFDTLNVVYRINTTRGNYSLSDWELTFKIKDDKNNIYYQNTEKPFSSFYEFSLNISNMRLKDNNFYKIEGTLKGLNNDIVQIYSYPFKKVGEILKRKVEFDKHGRMFFNGELFFPFGVCMEPYLKNFYLEHINRTHLNTILTTLTPSDLPWVNKTYDGRIKIINFLSLYTLNHSICQYYNEDGNYKNFIERINAVKKSSNYYGMVYK